MTYAEKGAKLWTRQKTTEIPVYPAAEVVDPTGAGDAFRAGLLYGIKNRQPLEIAAKMGAYLGAKAVEKAGTQNHTLNPKDWEKFLTHVIPSQEGIC